MTSTPKEAATNGKHSNTSILGKRKKVREKRSNYLQTWLEKSVHNNVEDNYDPFNTMIPSINYSSYPGHPYNQRLIAANSDPSVFRYAHPYTYQNEPVSLPVFPAPPYPSPYNPGVPDWSNPKWTTNPTNKPIKTKKKNNKKNSKEPSGANSFGIDFNRFQNGLNAGSSAHKNPGLNGSGSNVSSGVGTQNEFASLPPAVGNPGNFGNASNEESDGSGNQRRFSDPGLAANLVSEVSQEDSAEESDSGSSCAMEPGATDHRLVMCLVEQIQTLKETNRKLYKELHETRGELDLLKQQSGIWRHDGGSSLHLHPGAPLYPSSLAGAPSCPSQTRLSTSSGMYAPGMLTDLVREIREAARVREEALYSKVRTLLDDKYANKMNGNSASEKNTYPDWKNIEAKATEKSRTSDRLGKLEEELHNLRIRQSREDSFSSPPAAAASASSLAADQERQRLWAELREERAARAAADANAHKLELLVTHLRSKRGGQHHTASSVASPQEAPAASSDPVHMVLGPVTDL